MKAKISRKRQPRRTEYVVAIPQRTQLPALQRTARYFANNSYDGGITPKNICYSLGAVQTSSTSLTTFVGSFRIKQIDVYFTAATAGTALTSAIHFYTGLASFGVNSREVNATTMSTGSVTKLTARPTTTEIAGMWNSNTGTTNLFGLNVPKGSVIDLHVEFVTSDNDSGTSTITVTGAAAANTVYYTPLDGPVSGVLYPASLTMTL